MFLSIVLISSMSRPYDDGRHMRVSMSSKYWLRSLLFSCSSSFLKSASTAGVTLALRACPLGSYADCSNFLRSDSNFQLAAKSVAAYSRGGDSPTAPPALTLKSCFTASGGTPAADCATYSASCAASGSNTTSLTISLDRKFPLEASGGVPTPSFQTSGSLPQ